MIGMIGMIIFGLLAYIVIGFFWNVFISVCAWYFKILSKIFRFKLDP